MDDEQNRQMDTSGQSALSIGECFTLYEWTAEEVDAGIWRATFAAENERDFDVLVVQNGAWISFTVSPFVGVVEPSCRGRLWDTLLRLNQQARLLCFAVDDDDDVNLLVDLPAEGFTYSQFAMVLDLLTDSANVLADELQRLAADPTYRSSWLPVPQRDGHLA